MAEWFSEENFPFSKNEIALEIFQGQQDEAEAFLAAPNTRINWIFQQLLKFYAPFVIPGLSPNVLILDSDVIFLKKVRFISEKGEPFFIPGKERHPPYFEHAARLLPGLYRVKPTLSGVAHHMLFQKCVLEDLFSLIEQRHQTDVWRAICRCIDRKEIYGSCMSEYEIYFNFIQLRSSRFKVQISKWKEIGSLDLLEHYRKMDYAFIACPHWLRG